MTQRLAELLRALGARIVNNWIWRLGFACRFLWFTLKVYGFIVLMMWIRATLPRLRIDQLMSFCWKGLIPMALVNIVAVAIRVEK